jgi:hypothetical protein
LFTKNTLHPNFFPETPEINLFNPFNILNSFLGVSSMPMVSITVIDMTNSNFDIKQKIPRGLSSKYNELLLEDFPQISSQFIF